MADDKSQNHDCVLVVENREDREEAANAISMNMVFSSSSSTTISTLCSHKLTHTKRTSQLCHKNPIFPSPSHLRLLHKSIPLAASASILLLCSSPGTWLLMHGCVPLVLLVNGRLCINSQNRLFWLINKWASNSLQCFWWIISFTLCSWISRCVCAVWFTNVFMNSWVLLLQWLWFSFLVSFFFLRSEIHWHFSSFE